MKTLIILAHGSRRDEYHLEIQNLTEKVATLARGEFDNIEFAYLELIPPSLAEVIDNSIESGASHISILPYFLNSGNHVKQDIPEIIKIAEKKYPDCVFRVSSCIGMMDKMPELILDHINKP
jgi:sirohydrochlorin ferrochelatase